MMNRSWSSAWCLLTPSVSTSLPKHSEAATELRFQLCPLHRGGGGEPATWWIFQDIDVRLPNRDVVGPDLSGRRRECLTDPGDMRTRSFTARSVTQADASRLFRQQDAAETQSDKPDSCSQRSASQSWVAA